MEKAESYHTLDFFRLAYDALFNDMIAHAIKVLDRNKDSETFWSIYGREKTTIDRFLKDNNYDIATLNDVADKLKIIRDKTHFHIDRKGLLNPNDVWKNAGITGKELANAIDKTWEILNYVYRINTGDAFFYPDYKGSDATKIIKAAKKEGIV